MIPFLQSKLPEARIIGTDIRRRPKAEPLSPPFSSPYYYADVICKDQIEKLIVDHDVDTIIHFSALLSAIGELHPSRALQLNLESVHHILYLAQLHSCSVLIPSTIGAFGPQTPKANTPDITVMRPTTIYGITKLHMELLGEWYHRRFSVDFKSVRLPGVLSLDEAPGGGTTDYAIHMIHAARANLPYQCFLKEDSRLPMMHIKDAMSAFYSLLMLSESYNHKIGNYENTDSGQRVYNLHALDFTPKELEEALRNFYPQWKEKVTYVPDHRQLIADSWPQSLDDTNARRDWGWSPAFSSLDALLKSLKSSKA